MDFRYYFKTFVFLTGMFSQLFIFANGKTKYYNENSSSSISFTENKGQVSDQYYKARPDILFSGNAKGFTFHLRKNGISYQMSRVDSWTEREMKQSQKIKIPERSTFYRIDINWLNTDLNPKIEIDNALAGYTNYYSEVCPQGVHFVKAYMGVMYKNLYKGIDLHYYEKEGSLKYDYIVRPQADYKQIQLEVLGGEISLDRDGSLLITTPLGTINEEAPFVYQGRKHLKSKWILSGNVIGFEVEDYDSSQELIIDPIVRIWGTYYGGSNIDVGEAICTDANNNVYTAGSTSSNNQIATSGAHQSTWTFQFDGFLTKFNTDGVRQWATYYGAADRDFFHSCATDQSGNIYTAGDSDSFMAAVVLATSDAHQSTFGGSVDAIIVKFNNAGIREWASFYGGTYPEKGQDCCTDKSGNVYLAGVTGAITNISTIGSYQTNLGGFYDAFLVKFNPNGTRLWATYYGGDEKDVGISVCTDITGHVFLSGTTASTIGIASNSAHQAQYGGDTTDAFLVKFDSLGLREWGTYYGGSLSENSRICAVDPVGNVYLGGETTSTSFNSISTSGSHQILLKGQRDGFIAKFSANGLRLWGTYFGGSDDDFIKTFVCDNQSNLYIGGATLSKDKLSVNMVNSHQVIPLGNSSSFLCKFDPNGAQISGTYFGGGDSQADNYLYDCALDSGNNLYITGETSSSDAQQFVTNGCHQNTYGGYIDAFLAKFVEGATVGLVNISHADNKVLIFPNPTNGNFDIDLGFVPENITMEIFNSMGELILVQEVDTRQTNIDLKEYPEGVYFVKVKGPDRQEVVKLIKE